MQLLPAYIDVSQFNPPPKKNTTTGGYYKKQPLNKWCKIFHFSIPLIDCILCDNPSVTAIHMGRGPVLIDCRDFYLLH